jgi:L-asparaginase II
MGKTSLPVVEVLRNGSVESIHRGSIAVVDRNGNRLFFWGDFDFPTIMRSCAKPFQALPLIESGAADHFGLTDEELAIATGSISGQDFQEAAVRSILKKIGLNEAALQCGTHRPFHSPTAKRLEKEGKKAGPLRNSCAGKHAGILATCVFKNWPLETYTQLSHPIQRWIFEKVSEFTGVKANQIQISTDGCGLPTFQVPLKNLALSFARLTVRDESGISRLMACACQYPEMVAGENRICTDLIRTTRGRVFGKIGGEAVYGISLFERGLGIGIKIEDGSLRGLTPTVVEVLRALGVLTNAEISHLKTYHYPRVINYRKEVVGKVRPIFDILRKETQPGGGAATRGMGFGRRSVNDI